MCVSINTLKRCAYDGIMQLRIIHRGSELLTLSAEVDTSVLQVKAAIAKALRIPPNDQTLTFKGVYLEDSRSLNDYEIAKSGALELHLPLKLQKIIPVRVAISPEEVYSIPIRSNATVAELRAEIATRVGRQNRNVTNAFLVYSHWILEDLRRLNEYEIGDNACITVARVLEPEKQPSNEPYDYCDDFATERLPAPCRRMISVHFLKEDGDPFTLILDPSKPLKTISKSVEEKTGIPEENQTFIISGRYVDKEKTLDSLNIVEGDSVYLSDNQVRTIYPTTKKGPMNRNGMVIYFEVGKERFSMLIPDDWTVKDVQQKMQNHPSVKGGKIDLYYKNVRLESRRTLTECGVSNGGVIKVKIHYL
ncbi:Polyubiquitin-B [Echinococcus granulosus]|uniref:Ubiquitin C n=2 Tax=Echinococcus granulosus TaxID=6210 RepID=W6U595_ECHGR|nr:ubiquitin C [Echinococcus granulosus]EUB56300.1 ubiquitin C [Echinococcus granulosus]KAH9284672.1 Polyubiquitin-B [Echinococcus granulosus]